MNFINLILMKKLQNMSLHNFEKVKIIKENLRILIQIILSPISTLNPDLNQLLTNPMAENTEIFSQLNYIFNTLFLILYEILSSSMKRLINKKSKESIHVFI